jgi:hypothetical protein
MLSCPSSFIRDIGNLLLFKKRMQVKKSDPFPIIHIKGKDRKKLQALNASNILYNLLSEKAIFFNFDFYV